MALPPHSSQPAQVTQNTVWTLVPPSGIAFQTWIDGTIKIQFQRDKADELIACLENHLNAFKGLKTMLDNPPKKCVGCRGTGQIMVKTGDSKELQVCPKCSGSGLMGLIPLSVPSATLVHSHNPQELPAILPHQQKKLPDIGMGQGQEDNNGAFPPAPTLLNLQEELAKHGYKAIPVADNVPVDDTADESVIPPTLTLDQLAALANQT
jgi:hypothetical protein